MQPSAPQPPPPAAAADAALLADNSASRAALQAQLEASREETRRLAEEVERLQQRSPAAGVSLAGLTMVVTGGASGIGKSIVVVAAQKGCNVIYVDMRDSPLEGGCTTAEAAAGASGEVVFMRGDVTSEADLNAAAASAVERWGRLDVWVNNAALDLTDPPHSREQSLTKTTLDEWSRVMSVNAAGYLLGSQAAVNQFLRQPVRQPVGLRGKLISITSQHGMVACPGNVPYGCSKAVAAQMMRINAVDFAKDQIASIGVAPGKIVKDPERPVAEYSRVRTPCPRLGTPEDVALAVALMACDDARDFMTGFNLMVDGGWMAY